MLLFVGVYASVGSPIVEFRRVTYQAEPEVPIEALTEIGFSLQLPAGEFTNNPQESGLDLSSLGSSKWLYYPPTSRIIRQSINGQTTAVALKTAGITDANNWKLFSEKLDAPIRVKTVRIIERPSKDSSGESILIQFVADLDPHARDVAGDDLHVRWAATKPNGDSAEVQFFAESGSQAKEITLDKATKLRYFSAPSISLAPAYAKIEGASREWVIHAPFSLEVPNVLWQSTLAPVRFSLVGIGSTQNKDLTAGATAKLQQRFSRFKAWNDYAIVEWGLEYFANQSTSSLQSTGSLSVTVPSPFTAPNGPRYVSFGKGATTITPISFVHRDRIDPDLSTYHVATSTLNPSVTFATPMIYLMPRDAVDYANHPSVYASTQVWWFPNDRAVVGSAHRFEGRIDLHLQTKAPSIKLLRILNPRFDIGVGYGAVPNQGYATSPVLTVALQVFGSNRQFYRWP